MSDVIISSQIIIIIKVYNYRSGKDADKLLLVILFLWPIYNICHFTQKLLLVRKNMYCYLIVFGSAI